MYLETLLKDKELFDKNRIVTFDTETSDGLRGCDLWKIGLIHSNYNKTNFFVTEDLKEFVDYLINQIRKDAVIFAHNLEFDIRFLLNEAIRKKFIFYSAGILTCYLQFKKSKQWFTFRDSYALLPMSQEKLSESLDVTKKFAIDFEKGFENISDKDILLRIENDVLGLFEILVEANKFYFKRYFINLLKFMTIAQFSLSIFRANNLKKKILNPYFVEDFPLYDLYDIIRTSYFGARVECYDLNTHFDVIGYDINAMYSFVMSNFEFPIGKIRISNNLKKKDLSPFGFSDCELEIFNGKITPTPIRTKNGIYYPFGKIKGLYANQHLIFLEENNLGKILDIKKTYEYSDSEYLFKEFIEKLYDIRLGLQAKDNPMEILIKLIMNTSYGKFGQKPITTEYKQVDCSEVYLEADTLFSIAHDIYAKFEKRKLRNFSLVHIASFITNYAKQIQFDYLKKIEEDIIYTDTDSFIVPKKIKLKTSNKMGDLKLEKEFEVFKAFSPKAYYYQNENIASVKLKGFTKEFKKKIESMDINTFEKFIKHEGIRWEKYASFKRMIRPTKNTEFIDGYLAYESMSRSFPLQYDRRQILPSLLTIPINTKKIEV